MNISRIKRLAFALLRYSLVPWFTRELFQRRRVTVICYHDPSPEAFAQQLRALLQAYNPVGLLQVVDAAESGRWDALPLKPLVITLDDGHQGNYALLPVMQELGVRPTIFLSSGVVGTYRHFWWTHIQGVRRQRLKKVPDTDRLAALIREGYEREREYAGRQALLGEEIEALKEWADLQSHTVNHPILPMCSREQAMYEMVESKRQLEERYGVKIYALAYPNGSVTRREMKLAEAAGYRCALGLGVGSNSRNLDLFHINRIWVSDEACPNEALVRASGVWGVLRSVARFPYELGGMAQRGLTAVLSRLARLKGCERGPSRNAQSHKARHDA